MKLSENYQYIVLCEDAQMRSFILQFLKSHDINVRSILFRNYLGKRTTVPLSAVLFFSPNFPLAFLV